MVSIVSVLGDGQRATNDLWGGVSGRPFPLPEGEPILGLPPDTDFFAQGIDKVVEELADGLAQFRQIVGATG